MIHYSFIGYIVASAIILLICVIAYRLLLENKVRPSVNRTILLLIYGVMLLIPFIVALIPESKINNNIEIGQPFMVGIVEGEIEPEPRFTIDSEMIISLLSWVYFGGLFVMFIFSGMTLAKLIILMRNSVPTEINGTEVWIHGSKKLSSFSWLNRIFLYSDLIDNSKKDLDILLLHEKAHTDRGHWIDLAIAQIVLIFQWFNPAAWFMRRELQRIHEYEADEEVISSGVDEKEYQMLLIRNISRSRFSGLTDGLNNCSLKKRIIMMKKKTFKSRWALRGVALALVAIGGGAIIHIPAVASVLQQPIDNPETISKDGVRDEMDTIKVVAVSTFKKDPTKPMTISSSVVVNGQDQEEAIISVDGEVISKEDLESINPNDIAHITVLKNTDPGQIIITTKNSNDLALAETSTKEQQEIETNKTYVAVDEVANYTGGVDQLMRDLAKTIVYPSAAAEKKIEGTVVVKFVVDKNGDISNISIARGVDADLDAAAIQTVKNLPNKWIPAKVKGQPVDSYYNLPVKFQLTVK